MTTTTTTSTAAPGPHTTGAPLPMPTAADVSALQAVQVYPAVSVLCSTEPAPRLSRADAARLQALVTAALDRVADELGAGGASSLRREFDTLVAEAAGRTTRRSLALYAGAGHRSGWALPVPVHDRAVVDPTFATRDLVRSLHRTPRHVVLALSGREARLFDGAAGVLRPADTAAFPFTSVPRPSSAPGRRSASPGQARVDAEGDAFLRAVDRALGTYLRLRPAPLVLVGAKPTLARFTHLSGNLGRLAGVLAGNHTRTPLLTLAGLVRPVLDSYLRSRQDEALALLERRSGTGRAVTGMASVWLAARAERPEMLVVEQDYFYPARLSDDGDFLEPADDPEHPDVVDDAVDEVIELVLRRGGWIALADDGALAAQDRIALTLAR